MTIEKLKRVLWRVRAEIKDAKKFSREVLERAIMKECGTDPKTITHNKRALRKLGWVKFRKTDRVGLLTDRDLTEM